MKAGMRVAKEVLMSLGPLLQALCLICAGNALFGSAASAQKTKGVGFHGATVTIKVTATCSPDEKSKKGERSTSMGWLPLPKNYYDPEESEERTKERQKLEKKLGHKMSNLSWDKEYMKRYAQKYYTDAYKAWLNEEQGIKDRKEIIDNLDKGYSVYSKTRGLLKDPVTIETEIAHWLAKGAAEAGFKCAEEAQKLALARAINDQVQALREAGFKYNIKIEITAMKMR